MYIYIYNYNFSLIFESLKIKIMNKSTSLLKNRILKFLFNCNSFQQNQFNSKN